MSIEYRIGDVFDRLAEIPDSSIDLIVSSPPFLWLRAYLPDGHPDKDREIGQEATIDKFIDTHLALAAEYDRVLAPHGSLCYEIGDTYSGSGGAGGDYDDAGLRDGQNKTAGSARRSGEKPLSKSMCLVPHLFTTSLAYGRNILTGGPSPSGKWRIRNVICWARPNPPVGALGDKFRPATSYITVACKSDKRYFDLDAVRTDLARDYTDEKPTKPNREADRNGGGRKESVRQMVANPAGGPPLDWHADDHPEDGDWLWKLSTQPYKGSHFATFPMELPKRLIEAMCPLKVCSVCGTPSTRITELLGYTDHSGILHPQGETWSSGVGDGNKGAHSNKPGSRTTTTTTTIGWTDCGHDSWRTGVVLDPFGGSGTTGEAAQILGRHAILIDIDERNADLARERVGMFLEIDTQKVA